ncbi:hypothetical protein MC885_007870 [Smutsia gigantea]|nr:hypothetical protein MC885_007870 [Smutsia gigantea]
MSLNTAGSTKLAPEMKMDGRFQAPPHLQLHGGPCGPVDAVEGCPKERDHQHVKQDPHRPHLGLLAESLHRGPAPHRGFLQLHLRPERSPWAPFPQARWWSRAPA